MKGERRDAPVTARSTTEGGRGPTAPHGAPGDTIPLFF
jgi:hypothetical protein